MGDAHRLLQVAPSQCRLTENWQVEKSATPLWPLKVMGFPFLLAERMGLWSYRFSSITVFSYLEWLECLNVQSLKLQMVYSDLIYYWNIFIIGSREVDAKEPSWSLGSSNCSDWTWHLDSPTKRNKTSEWKPTRSEEAFVPTEWSTFCQSWPGVDLYGPTWRHGSNCKFSYRFIIRAAC